MVCEHLAQFVAVLADACDVNVRRETARARGGTDAHADPGRRSRRHNW